MAEQELKCSRMVKRSQGKKKLGVVNYKERVFTLTSSSLCYFDGNLAKRGQLKGTVPLKSIKAVEKVDAEAFNRQNAFQVIYDEFVLYIIATTAGEQEQWLEVMRDMIGGNAGLLQYYHPGLFLSNKWTCCHHSSKHSLGCKATFIARKKSAANASAGPLAGGSGAAAAATLQTQCISENTKQFDVIAIYNYSSPQTGDLTLTRDQRLTVIDNTREHWWFAENADSKTGYIPSNYVRRIGIESEVWFYADLSRQRAENLLRDDGKEGCFLIRNSSKPGMFTLSLLHGDAVRHYHIRKDDKNMFYIAERHHFETIPELVEYHSRNGGGLMTRLRRPPQQDVPQQPPTRDKWEIEPTDLELGPELGSGQFGVVVSGTYKDTIKVAIKMMKEGSMDEDDFIEEAKVMKNFQHSNLVQLYGVVTEKKPILIVTELMANGCLLDFLRSNKDLLGKPAVLVDMTIQVGSAMKFLEEHQFIHRDLAARNCLVGERLQVKVGDFGLARYVMDDEYTASEGTKFPIKWASPEVINYANFSSKSDVWAFGILIWELFTGGKTPYPTFTNAEVLDKVLEGFRLERPGPCPTELFKIVDQCWQVKPEDRPSFKQVYASLQEIGDDYSDPQPQ